MRIQTLGGLSARDATGLLAGEAAQPRRLALLALLARAGDRGLSRDRLVTFLWPDTDDERARRILSQALYALRQGLGGGEVFLGTQELRLNPALVTSDVVEFESLRREGSREKAAELYGGPFLDGFHLPGVAEFERWVEDERQSLAHDYAELLEQLASRATQDGDPRAAVGWWRKLAALDPLNARVAAALMRAYEAAGDPAGALRHARVYQALVAQELDVPADREIVALAERIRTQPAAALAPAPAHRGPEPEVAPQPSRPPAHRGADLQVAPGRRRPPVRWLAAFGVLAALGLAAALWLRRDPEPPPAARLMVGRIADYSGGSRNELGRPLADMIATDLARAPGLSVISTPRVYELLAQLGSSDSTTAGFMSAARHAGATELLDGALFDLGQGRIRLDLRRIDVATGAVLGAYSVQGADPFVLADSASLQLVADLGILAPAGPIADLTTRSLAAYRAYDAGLREYFARRFPAAEGHFAAAVRADSGFAMAWYYWALASRDDAVRLSRLDEALRRAPQASDRERLLISAQWALHNVAPTALALAETLAVRYPAEVDGHLFLGYALYGREEYPAGIRSFTRVVALDSLGLRGGGVRCAACEAYANLVAGYATVDSFPAAFREGRAWGAAQPRNPDPWRQMALASGQLGDSGAAAASLRRAESLDTNSTLRHAYRTALLMLAERYREAELADSARLATGVTGEERLDLLWNRMLLLAQQGRYEESLVAATQVRREVAALGPVEREGHPLAITAGLGEAQALRQTGRLGQASARFDSLARADLVGSSRTRIASNRAWILGHLAGVLAESGDTVRLAQVAAIIDSLSAVSGAWWDKVRVRYVTGLVEEARGRDQSAHEEFVASTSKAIDGFGMPALHRARLAIRLGRPAEAVALVQRLLRSHYHFYVTHPELHLALAEAWVAAGNRDSARTHLAAVDRAWTRADPPAKARLARVRTRLGFAVPTAR